ncbi:MAG: hypothetical protein WA364_04185, partial [Candidatus Nitrosopolaris sp.]
MKQERSNASVIKYTRIRSMGSTSTLENVLYEKKRAIAYVTINRPKVLNALNQKTWENLRAA